MFDPTDEASFDALNKYHALIMGVEPACKVIVVAGKMDLVDDGHQERVVDAGDVERWATEHNCVTVIETSAKVSPPVGFLPLLLSFEGHSPRRAFFFSFLPQTGKGVEETFDRLCTACLSTRDGFLDQIRAPGGSGAGGAAGGARGASTATRPSRDSGVVDIANPVPAQPQGSQCCQ